MLEREGLKKIIDEYHKTIHHIYEEFDLKFRLKSVITKLKEEQQ